MTNRDRTVIRELAKRYMELATSPEQEDMNRRMKATNDLKITRPPVLIDEIPWYQMNIDDELTCLCEDEHLRGIEYGFRTLLFRRKHFRCDTIFEPFFKVSPTVHSTGIGLTRDETILRTDEYNHITSHAFRDVLKDESALEAIHAPELSVDPEGDAKRVDYYSDLLGDAMPVKLTGYGYYAFLPWDDLAFLRGVEPILTDMYDRPEYLHAIMKKLVAGVQAELDFLEKNVLIDNCPANLHCTPGYVSGLAESGWKATWFRGTAQMFSCVSPAMHDEFEIQYLLPIAERFAYTYYGCCEPLDNKIGIIKKIKNLRKIGVSPWADAEACAEQIRGDYVYARKPNPANVAIRTDPDVIRREITETVRVCQKHGCPCEFVLKDISSVSGKPENLIVWAETVSDVLDEYYGR